MEEAFKSKLNRMGYTIQTSDLQTDEWLLRPKLAKKISGVLLIVFGILLMPQLLGPLQFLLSKVLQTEATSDWVTLLKGLLLGGFGLAFFYRGIYRLFDLIGFKLTVSPHELWVKKREDLKLKVHQVLNPKDFECDETDGYIVLSCLDQEGRKTELMREKNTIMDSLSTLQELTQMLKEKIITR